ncbi:MAG TPA: hemerythrin domain-containing protein [Gemmatimonadales bacterium]|nr:hemerythrin domain-containing protein [Gemmatimonadales bacterium]
MQATQTLRHEHEVIRKALALLDAVAARVAAGDVPPDADVSGLLEFFTVFADGCHHVKEETILFPALEAAGLPHGQGPLAVMLQQHDEGRRLVGVLRREQPALARDPEARARFAGAARDYAALLEQHITIENEVLFPRADGMLDAQRDGEIAAAYDRHEASMGADVHRRFHAMLDDLARRYA